MVCTVQYGYTFGHQLADTVCCTSLYSELMVYCLFFLVIIANLIFWCTTLGQNHIHKLHLACCWQPFLVTKKGQARPQMHRDEHFGLNHMYPSKTKSQQIYASCRQDKRIQQAIVQEEETKSFERCRRGLKQQPNKPVVSEQQFESRRDDDDPK